MGEQARSRPVYTDFMVMHDALDEYQVGKIPTGEAFRQRFGNPCAVIHRADAHGSLLEGVQASGQIGFLTSARVERIEQDANGVTVHDQHGTAHQGLALIGAGRAQEEWGVKEGRREKVQSCFQGICPKARQLIDLPKRWKRWATADHAVHGAGCVHGDRGRGDAGRGLARQRQ